MAPNIPVPGPTNGPQRRVPDVFDALHGEMDRLFRSFERNWPHWPGLARGGAETTLPSLDVRENAEAVTIEADLPGLDEKDVHVTLLDGVLTIKGERKSELEEKNESYHVSERSFGSFARSVRLPDSVDENRIEARFDKGVLKVVAAKKAEAVASEKKIEVKKA